MDIQNASFEEKLAELEHILDQLENGELPLAQWVEQHIKGKKLIDELDLALKEAAQMLEVIDTQTEDV